MTLTGTYPGFDDEYADGRWEPATRDILRTYLRPGSLFIDIGAWVGPVTRWALDLGATVHAYEPDPIAFSHLVENCPTASCRPWAITTHGQIVTLHNAYGDSNTQIGEGTTRAHSITPQTVCANLTPALIKIDVEGYETEILPAFLAIAQCPIWVAWHEKLWPDNHTWDFTGWNVDGPVTGWGHSLLTRIP